VEVDLAILQECLAGAVPALVNKDIEPDLVRARLADKYRDVQLEPVAPAEFDALTTGLDDESWRRLGLTVGALDLAAVGPALPQLLGARPVRVQIEEAFVGLAKAVPLLTLELLRQSPLRVEEFARHFLARLGAMFIGETTAQSQERLERLDYGRLLAEAERAKQLGQERMDHLRQLQEEQDLRRRRRGKW
jgi:hypothetical protein